MMKLVVWANKIDKILIKSKTIRKISKTKKFVKVRHFE